MQPQLSDTHLLADVIPPMPASPFYTYLADAFDSEQLKPGMAVKIPLGSRKVSGIVLRVYRSQLKAGIEYKSIDSISYPQPVIDSLHLDLWKWVSSYYLCPLGAVMMAAMPYELLSGLYRDKTEKTLKLSDDCINNLDDVKAHLKTQKQRQCLDYFAAIYPNEISRVNVPNDVSLTALKKLVELGMVKVEARTVNRQNAYKVQESLKTLSDAQNKALTEIKEAFKEQKTVLLHGVPASGKTEIYKQLIHECIESGGQALYLVPEILLTSQLTDRLGRVFGPKLAVVHSMIGVAQKAEAFRRAVSGEPMVLIGARSAVFAPLKNLKLVIVDEEHDSSFKQEEKSPLYNGKNVSLVLAKMCNANVILGSATPSVESYYNAKLGKYKLVHLSAPFHEVDGPKMSIVDMREQRRKRKLRHDFSFDFMQCMERTVQQGRQVILFHGRRGYNTYTVCDNCGWVPKCPNCGVSLVYHKTTEWYVCHYCGYHYNVVDKCPECGGHISRKGSGTEKIQHELNEIYPDLRTVRLDTDSCKTMSSWRKILDDFEQGHYDVLIGTQMLVKGLDFSNVGMVGVPNADLLLNFPDFRALERAFQILLQVSGRGGRKDKAAEFVVQTSKPDHPVFTMLRQTAPEEIYGFLLKEREFFNFPPFYRLVEIELRNKDVKELNKMLCEIVGLLKPLLSDSELSGPFVPYPARIGSFYRADFLLKNKGGMPVGQINSVLSKVALQMLEKYGMQRSQVFFNVDP